MKKKKEKGRRERCKRGKRRNKKEGKREEVIKRREVIREGIKVKR